MRALMLAVGWAWLLASLPTVPASWHQAILAVSLLIFPSARVSRSVQWVLFIVAIPLAFGISSQPAMAMFFLVTGVVVFATTPGRPSWVWVPVLSCMAMGSVVGGLWSAARLDPDDFDPRTGLLIYQLVLIAVSLGFAVASRNVSVSRLTDIHLGKAELSGIHGLRAVLAETLSDPSLQIRLGRRSWQAQTLRVSAHSR
jgi:hypothetical protein